MHTTSRPRKRLLATLLAVVLVLSLFPAAAFAATNTFPDVPDWATTDVEYLYAKGLTAGVGDGTKFGSTQELTGNEFFVFADRALKLSGTSSTASWDAQKSAAVTALKKYGIDTSDANSKITREVVFADLAILLGLDDNAGALVGWSDSGKVSADLKGKVGAFVGAGYVAGTSTGEKVLNPQGVYTRQEYAGIFHRVLGNYIDNTGTTDYSKVVNSAVVGAITVKNLTVANANTQIKGASVSNLIVGAGVGEGDVYLNNVTIKDTLVVFGGGSKCVRITGTSNINRIVVAKVGSPVLILVQNTATVKDVVVNEDVDALFKGKFASITAEEGASVTLTGATVTTLTLAGEAAEASVTNSNVTTLTASAAADEAKATVKSSVVTTITNAAPDSVITVTDSAVTTITATGSGAVTNIGGTSVVGTAPADAKVTETAKKGATATEIAAKTTAVTADITTAVAATEKDAATAPNADAIKTATIDSVDTVTSGGSTGGGTSSGGTSSGPSREPGAPAATPSPSAPSGGSGGTGGTGGSETATAPKLTVKSYVTDSRDATSAKISLKSDTTVTYFYKVAVSEPLVDELKQETINTGTLTANADATELPVAISVTTETKFWIILKDTAGNYSILYSEVIPEYVPGKTAAPLTAASFKAGDNTKIEVTLSKAIPGLAATHFTIDGGSFESLGIKDSANHIYTLTLAEPAESNIDLELTLTHSDYAPSTTKIVRYEEKYDLIINVSDARGSVIPSASIGIDLAKAGETKYTKTDDTQSVNGAGKVTLTFVDVETGKYDISVVADDYAVNATSTATVSTASPTASANIVLKSTKVEPTSLSRNFVIFDEAANDETNGLVLVSKNLTVNFATASITAYNGEEFAIYSSKTEENPADPAAEASGLVLRVVNEAATATWWYDIEEASQSKLDEAALGSIDIKNGETRDTFRFTTTASNFKVAYGKTLALATANAANGGDNNLGTVNTKDKYLSKAIYSDSEFKLFVWSTSDDWETLNTSFTVSQIIEKIAQEPAVAIPVIDYTAETIDFAGGAEYTTTAVSVQLAPVAGYKPTATVDAGAVPTLISFAVPEWTSGTTEVTVWARSSATPNTLVYTKPGLPTSVVISARPAAPVASAATVAGYKFAASTATATAVSFTNNGAKPIVFKAKAGDDWYYLETNAATASLETSKIERAQFTAKYTAVQDEKSFDSTPRIIPATEWDPYTLARDASELEPLATFTVERYRGPAVEYASGYEAGYFYAATATNHAPIGSATPFLAADPTARTWLKAGTDDDSGLNAVDKVIFAMNDDGTLATAAFNIGAVGTAVIAHTIATATNYGAGLGGAWLEVYPAEMPAVSTSIYVTAGEDNKPFGALNVEFNTETGKEDQIISITWLDIPATNAGDPIVIKGGADFTAYDVISEDTSAWLSENSITIDFTDVVQATHIVTLPSAYATATAAGVTFKVAGIGTITAAQATGTATVAPGNPQAIATAALSVNANGEVTLPQSTNLPPAEEKLVLKVQGTTGTVTITIEYDTAATTPKKFTVEYIPIVSAAE